MSPSDSAAPTSTSAAPPDAGSARRQELLTAAYAWVGRHGWAGMSLRPLAQAIGSSPRVLLFLFGSKDGLIRALLARSRADQLTALEHLRAQQPVDHPPGLAMVALHVWEWLADPEHRSLLRIWLGAYSQSVQTGPEQPWTGFASSTVHDWDQLLADHQPTHIRMTAEGDAQRTLLLAVLRGSLLDLLATDDRERLDRAVRLHLTGSAASS